MKAHGISGSASGRNTATPGPSAPSTPGSAAKTASAKKRKTTHTTEDADDAEEVKTEIKTEGIKAETKDSIKMEAEDFLDMNGSYTNPSNPESAAAATLVTMAEGTRPAETNDDDEVYLICATEKTHDVAVTPQVYTYQGFPPLESRPVIGHNDVACPGQPAQFAMIPPYEFNADFHSPKVSNAFDPGFDGTWIHPQDPVFFWNDMIGLDVPQNFDHA